MSQRSVMNERNQNPGEHKGKTRKSAASAKPVSKAASSVYVADPNFKPKQGFFDRQMKKTELTPKQQKAEAARKAARKEENARKDEIRRYKPKSKEYRKWRLVWLGFICAGIVSITPTIFLANYIAETGSDWLNILFLVLAWGCLTAAIVTDIRKVKPAREAAYYKEANPKKKAKKK